MSPSVYNVRMRKTKFALITISMLVLAGCGRFSFPNQKNSSSIGWNEDDTSVPQLSSSEGQSAASDETKTSENISSGGQASSGESSFAGDRKIHIYAINDFHGQILESSVDYEIGAAKLFSYLKDKNDEGNTLLCNQGDLYQGSLESNYNRGRLLTDIINYTGFDCMTLGNHEFDWGQTYIEKNKNTDYSSQSGTAYKTPFLAANVYDYNIDTKKVGTTQQSNLGQEYTISTLENGLKVGIIGVIGVDQITSITSQYVDNIVFTDPIKKVKQLSDKLRNEDKVDFVVASIHSGTDVTSDDPTINQSSLAEISSVSGKRYCDCVLTAHTHLEEYQEVNGVPFIQDYCYGKAIGNLEFTVSSDGTVSYDSHKVYHYADMKYQSVDENIQNIIDYYAEETTPIGNESLTTFSGEWGEKDHIPNILAESLYKEATNEGYDVQFAIVNRTRATIHSGEVTYSKLFTSVPFDNETMIIECTGADLINQTASNYVYRGIGDAVDSSKTYKVAVIDYLATHRNKYRNYNYFPSMVLKGTLKKDGEPYLYRSILANYLKTKSSWSNSNYATSKNARFNRTLTNAVEL